MVILAGVFEVPEIIRERKGKLSFISFWGLKS